MKNIVSAIKTLLFAIVGYFIFHFAIEWLFGNVALITTAILFLIIFLIIIYIERNYKLK